MGNSFSTFWSITIQGIGAHHNAENEHDADKMAREFVRALVKAGHRLGHATFTYGANDQLLPIFSEDPGPEAQG